MLSKNAWLLIVVVFCIILITSVPYSYWYTVGIFIVGLILLGLYGVWYHDFGPGNLMETTQGSEVGGRKKRPRIPKLYDRKGKRSDIPDVCFDDVAGQEEAKEELREVVEFLLEPDSFTALGATIPKGTLLVGAPGLGKTLIARAVAGEASVNFVALSGSEFVEIYSGKGAKRVREAFDTARKKKPCIMFIDEIDAVGRRRGNNPDTSKEAEQTITELLTQMDGFIELKDVIIIGATNRPEVLDPALLRPGRFGRKVTFFPPDRKARKQILDIHTREKPLAADVDLAEIARDAHLFSGAELADVTNEAAIFAQRNKRNKIIQQDLRDGVAKVRMGPERKSVDVSERDKKLTAYHEAGHAVTAVFCDEATYPSKVTILPSGLSGGHTIFIPEEERMLKTRQELRAMITVGLGGRAGEQISHKTITTGSSDDLKGVTQIAHDFVARYGMSDDVGPFYMDSEGSPRTLISPGMVEQIDTAVQDLLKECLASATEILHDNAKEFEALAQALLERDTLHTREEIEEVLK